ncbi:hypothetical protein CI105_03865 [Candidatus Izimaplasma bacterium ZiA1]|uniref:hypothetical protein n=1 Tax=Candidatus Izimoplasma sp. ZiA1 TaxID=2024899 RepID=UPI000BAA6CB8|nr:hypothetical protein CI105_03865 [Candidatus Izimaplasma bacterium ZiA1]
MKKILSLLLLAIFTFTLSACNLLNKDPEDTRTPQEILADTVVDTWDGDVTHLSTMMNLISESGSMEVVTEVIMDMTSDGENQAMSIKMTDKIVETETSTMMYRLQETTFDGLTLDLEMIYHYTDTGVYVYVNIDSIKEFIEANGDLPTELVDAFDAFGITEDWIKLSFDDNLNDIVKMELLNNFLKDALLHMNGPDFFDSIRDEIILELGLDPLTVGLDLDEMVNALADEDFETFKGLIDDTDFAQIIDAIDINVLAPGMVEQLSIDSVELTSRGLDVPTTSTSITTNGLLGYLETATQTDKDILVQYYIVEGIINQPDFETIPGFDFAAFVEALLAVDIDQLELETMIDIESLYNAIYAGQDAFNLYVTNLAITDPIQASLLTPFSETVLFLEDYKYIADDVVYAFENLSVFDKYFDMTTYIDMGASTVELVKNEDLTIQTNMTMGNDMYDDLFDDLLLDIYNYLDGFDSFELPYVENISCPVGEVCEPFEDYQMIKDNLGLLADIGMMALYDPSNLNEMHMEIDLAPLMNSMAQIDADMNSEDLEYSVPTFNTVKIIQDYKKDIAITTPATFVDMNPVFDKLGKLMLLGEIRSMLDDVAYYYTINPLEFPVAQAVMPFTDFDDNYMVSINEVFDKEMSTFTIGGTLLAPTYTLNLYWIDGTSVFTEPVSLTTLDLVFDSGIPTKTVLDSLLAKIDTDNFYLSKLLLVMMMQEEDNYDGGYYN